ncbi:accelerated cell death 6-like protein [Tanacetum coccineum]
MYSVLKQVGDGQKITQHLPLYKAAVEGDVKSLHEILEKEPTVVRDIITGASETALIIASHKENNNEFVAELVKLLSQDDLAMQNSFGRTAMFGAAATGNVKTLEIMKEKNKDLPNIRDMYNLLPLHFAAYAGQKHSVHYLLKVTKLTYEEVTERLEGSSLITALISGGFYDICLNMLKECPQLAVAEVSPLETLTNKNSAFLSGAHFSFWQRKIYSYLPSELQCPVDYYKSIGDTENPVEEVKVPKIKRIQQKKVMHTQALELLRYICSEIAKCDGKKVRDIIGHPLANAAAMGNAEVVEEILVAFPNARYLLNEIKHSVFHIAIANRKASVFNIIYQIRTQRHLMLAQRDASSNTALHLAAYLVDKTDIHSSLDLRSSGPGPALRMQYELQWFKEVKRQSWRQDRELRNKDGKRPATIFAETHADLAKEGEQWMKDRANSGLIIATLIATIVFASAITVPGGSNSNTGIPIFSHRQAFLVFAVSDALALFLSASSMLMFLGILTARYAIKDFLHSLPKRLILALVTLFLSIIFMMVAFTAIIYLVFGDERIWVLGLVSSLASVPVLLFAALQFNPLVDIISSTYGPGIFRKRGSCIRI